MVPNIGEAIWSSPRFANSCNLVYSAFRLLEQADAKINLIPERQ
jgi:hypothetical protein